LCADVVTYIANHDFKKARDDESLGISPFSDLFGSVGMAVALSESQHGSFDS